jgi:hypothetical protein
MKLKKRKVVVDERDKDPYYAMMKEDEGDSIEPRYSNHYDLSDENHHKYYDIIEKNIGRYPQGFRHYENYENYRLGDPHATL